MEQRGLFMEKYEIEYPNAEPSLSIFDGSTSCKKNGMCMSEDVNIYFRQLWILLINLLKFIFK
jgi:hypothetical protein